MGLRSWRAVHDGRYCYAVSLDADESTLLIDTESVYVKTKGNE
ncbi:MAG: hypothetical protein QGG64_29910 [Candidatus Latescibacteria bacterium]|nr:hypothetical protein [Candidatus Latescibacterota bacterium]